MASAATVAKHNYSVGPWCVTSTSDFIRVRQEASDAVLVTIEDGGHPELELVPLDEQMANARLIATAPELLEVLSELVETLRREAPGTPLNNHRFDALGIKANAVIAKARGRS